MLKKIKSLISANKNALFMLAVATVLTIIGFFIKQSFFSDNSPTPQGSFITFEDYKQDLATQKQQITKKLSIAHNKEKDILQAELTTIQAQTRNPKQSYETRIAQLKQRIQDLEAFKNNTPNHSKRLNQAISTLKQGNDKQADTLLAEIEQNSADAIKVAAEAAFQRAKIAQDDIRYQDALKHYVRAQQLQPNNSLYLNKLAFILHTLGEYDKAIKYFELTLASDLKTYGENHPKVATYRNNLGNAWDAKGQYDKAIEYYELALASDLKTYGENHPDVAIRRNNLGNAWDAKGQYDKAIKYFELALASDLKTYGENHPKVATYRNNLGNAWDAKGQYDKAIEYYELALASGLKTYGENHPKVAIRHNNLGFVWHAKGQYDKAIKCPVSPRCSSLSI